MHHFKDQFDSLVSSSGTLATSDRRTFLKTALGVGFAAAVLPVSAQTMHTDSVGLSVGEVSIDVNGDAVRVYRAQPAGKTNLPVILVISEIFGVHEHIADVARRWAKLGYLALAPDLFARQGNPAAYATVAEVMRQVVAKVPDAQVIADLDAVVAWAKQNGGNPQQIGINGFCWGGRFVWLYAAHNPSLKAGVAWYGKLAGGPSALSPTNPLDIAATLKVPVLGLYGGADPGIPVSTVEQMKQALVKAGNQSAFVVYPGVGHAFNADYRPSYVASAATDGWQRAVAWFAAHGVGGMP